MTKKYFKLAMKKMGLCLYMFRTFSINTNEKRLHLYENIFTRSKIFSVSWASQVVKSIFSGRGIGQVLDAAHETLAVRHLSSEKKHQVVKLGSLIILNL